MRTYSLKVDSQNSGVRLDIFLTENLTDIPSRNFIKHLIESQDVTVNNKPAKAHYKVLAGDKVKVKIPPVKDSSILPEDIPLDIFYEDKDFLVVNKPAGMLVHPAQERFSGTLVNALLYHCKNLSDLNEPFRAGIVHRLDEETSGLIVVAKNNTFHAQLAKQFEEHTVKKRYVALVEGLVEFDEGVVDAALGRHPRHRDKKAVVFYEEDAKEAKTFYKVLKRFKETTLIALFPQTGRTHQLRVHMAYLGHPVLGDTKYGKRNSFLRLALHAQSIGFRHPRTCEPIEFSCTIPSEFLSRA